MVRIALAILMLLQLLVTPWAARGMSLQHVACEAIEVAPECCCCCGESCGCSDETNADMNPLSAISQRVTDATCRCPVRAQPTNVVSLVAVASKPQATVKPAPATIKPIGPDGLARRIAASRLPLVPVIRPAPIAPTHSSLCRWTT